MTSIALIICGALVLLCAFAIGMNTSAGGTRSDHNDGSYFIALVGTYVFAIGVIAAIYEVLT